MKAPSCPYCNQVAAFVTGTVIYPHRPDLAAKFFYHCLECDAYVGCHDGTTRPLGRLANAELRAAKIEAHAAFDPLWRPHKQKRGEAYAWLAKQLGISREECHIGMFDVAQCKQVVQVCQQQLLQVQ